MERADLISFAVGVFASAFGWAAVFAGGPASAHAMMSLDITAFTIGDVTLGMGSRQAMQAIRAHGTLSSVDKKPCVSDWLVEQMRHRGQPDKNCVSRLTWSEGPSKFAAVFTEGFPGRLGATVATQIADTGSPVAPGAAIRAIGQPAFVAKTAAGTVEKWCDGTPCSRIDSVTQGANDAPFLLVTRYPDGRIRRSLDAGRARTIPERDAREYLRSHGVTSLSFRRPAPESSDRRPSEQSPS
jgi:hypothetical protein